MTELLQLGTRLSVNKHKATVRYIGQIDGQAGEWVGLEWDDVSRGKHDGSHGGRRYFSCFNNQLSGSFIRLPKLLEAADLGQTVVQAIESRYINTSTAKLDTVYVPTVSNQRQVPIELVGAEQAALALGDASKLKHAVLTDLNISHLGSVTEIQAALYNIVELDLSMNLISSWKLVEDLAIALPGLTTLNLSDNVLDTANSIQQPLTNIKTLVLNRCRLTWSDILGICSKLPNLIELHACDNSITTLKTDDNGQLAAASVLQNLQVVDLEDNLLESWDDVSQQLDSLPSLHSLLLSGNPISTITSSNAGGFKTLKSLMLGKTKIDTWGAVDQLDKLPALEDLRISDTPLTSTSPSAARYECIARLAHIVTLNGSRVSSGERWDAELTYLRYITNQSSSYSGDGGSSTRAIIIKQHPRYEALIKKYGELLPSETSSKAGTALSKSMVSLSLIYGDRQIQKKIPLSLTVGKLKILIEKLHKIKSSEQQLVLQQSGEENVDITHEDGRELRLLDIASTGCSIRVSKIDASKRVEAYKRSQQVALEVQELRMEQQEMELQRLRAEEQRLMLGR